MDRNSDNKGSSKSTANTLLEKLKNDLKQNASDKETIAAEEAAAKADIGHRYHFRVMKKAEYLEKKRIADKLAAAADEADISDEDLEALLRSYLKNAPKEKPVIEKTDEIITGVNAPAPDRIKDAKPEAAPPTLDWNKPLSQKEAPFFEEGAPEQIESVDEIPDADDEDWNDLLALLPDSDQDSAVMSADTPEQNPISVDEDENLAALFASLPDDTDMFPAFDKAADEAVHSPAQGGADASPLSASVSELPDVLSDFAEAKTPSSISDAELEAMLAAIDAENTQPPTAQTAPSAPAAPAAPAASDTSAADTQDNAFDDDFLSDDALFANLPSDEFLSAPQESDQDSLSELQNEIPDDLLDELPDTLIDAAEDTQSTADSLDVPTEAADASETTSPAIDAAESADTAADAAAPQTDIDDSELDQTDLDLMIAFGMEDQLEKAVGQDKAGKYKKAIGERGENHYNRMHMADRPDTVQDRHAEYVSSAQNKEIFSEYKKKYGNLLFRFFGAFLFLLLLFFFENDRLLGIKMPAIFDREQYPLVYVLFDLQLVVLSGAMVWRGIRTGIRAMLRARPVPESITGFLFLACLVNTVIIAALCPMHGLQLYNFPIALAVLFELCYEFMNLRREIMSFKIVSSKKLKYAVDAIAPKDGEAERRMFAEYISDDPSMFRIKRTAFVEGFFQRTETYPRTQRILRSILPAVLLLILAFFASEFILSGSVYSALTVSYITMLLTLPSCAFIMFSYPMYRASGFAYEKDSAMIGEATLGEYADASVVSFDDKEVFPARGVRVRNVKVYGNNRIDHVIYAAASVFHVIGGPLAEVFETATGELGYAENVRLIRLDRDGIEARVDGGTVLIGRAAFINRYGYHVSLSESETSMEETGDASILYVAYDNNVAAKLYIQYAVEPDFEVVLKQLYRQGICVGIKTSDPNIDDHLLATKIKMSKYPVRIIKCAEPKETAIIVDRLSSGIVSKSGAKALLQTLAACDRVLSASRTNNVLCIVSILLGIAAMAFFVIAGMPITVAPLFIALYQLFWIIPVIAISRYYI